MSTPLPLHFQQNCLELPYFTQHNLHTLSVVLLILSGTNEELRRMISEFEEKLKEREDSEAEV